MVGVGEARGPSATFVVGVRGGAAHAGRCLREQLVRALFQLAAGPSEAAFNVVAFSSKVFKWCNRLVRCSLRSVAEAAAWIRSLHFEDGTAAASGVAVAFEDPACEEVHLFTNVLPEHESEGICRLLAENQLHPVHVVCLLGDSDDYERGKRKAMEKIARQSGGSFQGIRLPRAASEMTSSTSISQAPCGDTTNKDSCGSLLTACPATDFSDCIWSPDFLGTPLVPSAQGSSICSSPKASSFMRGARVLARRQTDGYYYLGHIVKEVTVIWDARQKLVPAALPKNPIHFPVPRLGEHVSEHVPRLGATIAKEAENASGGWNRRRQLKTAVTLTGAGANSITCGSRERFLIAFDKRRMLKGKTQLRLQETPLHDILHYEDARHQPLAPGDRVLAPWEAKAESFGPGTVLMVTEDKEAPSGHNRRGVLVHFWNGLTKEVTSDQALRVSLPLSEHIILELQMPLAARQMVIASSPHYPYIVPPGYRASGCCQQDCSHLGYWPMGLYLIQPCTKCSSRDISPPHCCPHSTYTAPTQPTQSKAQEDALIPGTNLTKEELSRKIEKQLAEGKSSISETVSREEKKEEKRLKTENTPDSLSCKEEDNDVTEPSKHQQRKMGHAMIDTAVSMESCLTESLHKEEADRGQQADNTEAALKREHGPSESKVAETPIQRPQESPSVRTSTLGPFSRQSFFDHIDQSLKTDSLTIKAALCVQRPHSTSNMQAKSSADLLNLVKEKAITNSLPNSASEKKGKAVDFNELKLEHKRQQEEQRQLKREQQQKADGVRRQLRRDKQRQQFLQRTLQGLEKEQEHKDRARQHTALLQAAMAERSRKASSLVEEEKKKANQRLQFLKTQRLEREAALAERNERSFEQEKRRLALLRSRMQSRQEMQEHESRDQDQQQKQHQAAKKRVFQSRERSHQQMEEKGQKRCDLQQYLRDQNLLRLRMSLLE